jgi:HSP20 family protein
MRGLQTTFSNPFSLLDALFEGVTPGPDFFSVRAAPRFEVDESEDGYSLSLDLPGVAPEDLNVTVEDGVLTVTGERELEVPEGYRARRSERSRLKIDRSITLGDRVDPAGIEAKLEHGVLTLTLPKRPETKPRRIEIA